MNFLRVTAPFGVFRTNTAGACRPTATFLTYSAAYGLLLNVAGINNRTSDPGKITFNTPPKSPVRIAVGSLGPLPTVQRTLQHVHNYKSSDPKSIGKFGHKMAIKPVHREFLAGIDAVVAFDGPSWLSDGVVDGLAGRVPRYGFPFLGDSDFTVSRLELVSSPVARWYVPVVEGDSCVRTGVTRLSIWVNRSNGEFTRSGLFYPVDEQGPLPAAALVEV